MHLNETHASGDPTGKETLVILLSNFALHRDLRSKTPNGLEINFGGGFPSSLSSLSFLSSAIVQTPVAIAAQLVSIAILDGGLIDYCINH